MSDVIGSALRIHFIKEFCKGLIMGNLILKQIRITVVLFYQLFTESTTVPVYYCFILSLDNVLCTPTFFRNLFEAKN